MAKYIYRKFVFLLSSRVLRHKKITICVCGINLLTLVLFLLYFVALRNHLCWRHFFYLDNNSYGRQLGTTNRKELVIPSLPNNTPWWDAPSVPTSFLIGEEDFCIKRPRLKVIAYVHSAIANVKERQDTRDTWADASSGVLAAVFIVGRAKDRGEEEIVAQESKRFGDIVQGNFTDLYELLVYKALCGLHWVTRHCSGVPWVLHADDDVLIDVPLLLNFVRGFEANPSSHPQLFCHQFSNSVVRRKGKWAVTRQEYPCEFYPTYCAGPCWFGRMEAVRRMYEFVPAVRYLWLDDVYLTGLVAERAGVDRVDVPISDGEFSSSKLGYILAWYNIEKNKLSSWTAINKFYATPHEPIDI